MSYKIKIFFCFICLSFYSFGQTPAIFADLSEHLIAIHTGFEGKKLLLYGAYKNNHDVAVIVKGPLKNFSVQKKIKKYGIWVKNSPVILEDTPSFFKIASTNPIDHIFNTQDCVRHQLSFDTLHINSTKEYKNSFINHQIHQTLYSIETTPIQFVGSDLFRVTLNFPSNIPPGIYTVHAYLVKDKTIMAVQSIPLHVNKIGLSAEIFTYALHKENWYGLIAIILALFLGLTGGILFKRK